MSDMELKYKKQPTVPRKKYEGGIALLITMLLMGVLLGIGAALLNITLKQYQLSGVTFESEIAFQAANAAMECALYNHYTTDDYGVFVRAATSSPTDRAEISCFNQSNVADLLGAAPLSAQAPDNEQHFQVTWGEDRLVCSDFSVYIFYDEDDDVPVVVDGEDLRDGRDCRAGSICAVFKARGYNVPCADIAGGGRRVVEREFTLVY